MKILGLTLGVTLLLTALYLSTWLTGPDLQGEFTARVSDRIEIRFDDYGRPFVSAESFEDAFFAQGWLHARDRLWQMDTFRRAATGSLAELLGPDGLETDTAIWRSGVPALGDRMARVASAELNAFVAAYIAGINAWLQEQSSPPLEFLLLRTHPQPWTSRDVFAMAALMAYQSANNSENELLRYALVEKLGERAQIFFPTHTPLPNPMEVSTSSLLQTLAHLDLTRARTNQRFFAPSLGSNGWAVASGDGPALFAFDSHDSVSLPNLTYDVHLFVDSVGGKQIRGNSVPGLPGVINGYNEFMAWGFTNIGDSQDLFLETRDPQNPLRFKGRSGWYIAKKETIQIQVRDQAPRTVDIVHTENGRLISEEPPLSLRWAPLEKHNFGLDALIRLNRATSFAAFNQALDEFVAPSANATYADVTGRVAQRTLGLLPERGKGVGLIPQKADDEGTNWQSMLPLDGLPASNQSPAIAANRPIAESTAEEIPLISADNAPGYRVARISSFLTSQPPNVDNMQALQTDEVNLQAQRLLPHMLSHIPETQNPETNKILKQWLQDGALDRADSSGALIFAMWYQHLIEALFREPLGEALYAYSSSFRCFLDCSLSFLPKSGLCRYSDLLVTMLVKVICSTPSSSNLFIKSNSFKGVQTASFASA